MWAAAACLACSAVVCTGMAGPQPPTASEAREIPVPPITTPMGSRPGVGSLPDRPALPDVLVMDDGRPVTTARQWARRREEMRRTLAYYAVGQMPPPPGNVGGRERHREAVVDPGALYRQVRLTFGPGSSLTLDIGILTPSGAGPFPAILLPGGTPPGGVVLPRLPQGPNQGRGENVLTLVGPKAGTDATPVLPATPPATAAAVAAQRAEVLRRGYALVLYNANDCAEDTTLRNADGSWAFRTTRVFPAYPGYDWGVLAGWAWCASRVADYLERDPSVDARRVIVTGASRLGKAAMIAAAFDDRLMGAPVVTGGGGIGAYRAAGPRGSETLDLMETKYPNWFSPQLHQFRGHRNRLPFDQHWFLALAAPRPFLALEGDADVISLPDAVRQSMGGARPAYALLGVPERLGVHYARHGHAFTEEDWAALLDFFDWHLRGTPPSRAFDTFPTDTELDAALARAKAAAR